MNLKLRSMAFLGLSGSILLATTAVATNEAAPAVQEATPSQFISDGSVVRFDQDRASLVPIPGWQVEPKGAGMALVMKEVITADPNAPVDYSKPLFARNISVLTLNHPSPIDESRAASFQEEYMSLATRDGVMKDLQITSHKFFNYKGENDGLVFFAQHTANGFQMMQMMILISGEEKQYLLTFTDLASQFANPESYDAAWKSMTSILVPGVAPKRYMKEMKISGAVAGGLALIILPFGFARLSSQRRIRKMIDELQADWDNGAVSMCSMVSNVSHLDATRVARVPKKSKMASTGTDMYDSDVGSFATSAISTRKNSFKFSSMS